MQELKRLYRGSGKSVPGSEAATALTEDTDYLSGKWVERESLIHLYGLLVCLFYLALILKITGMAVLGTQILSDRGKKEEQKTGAHKIQASAFRFPAFTGDFWIVQSVGISLLIFLFFYGIYILLCFFAHS